MCPMAGVNAVVIESAMTADAISGAAAFTGTAAAATAARSASRFATAHNRTALSFEKNAGSSVCPITCVCNDGARCDLCRACMRQHRPSVDNRNALCGLIYHDGHIPYDLYGVHIDACNIASTDVDVMLTSPVVIICAGNPTRIV